MRNGNCGKLKKYQKTSGMRCMKARWNLSPTSTSICFSPCGTSMELMVRVTLEAHEMMCALNMVVTPVTKYLIDSVLANWNLFLLMMCEGLGERGRAILQMMDWLGKVTGKGIGMIGAGHGMSNEKQVSRHGIKGEIHPYQR